MPGAYLIGLLVSLAGIAIIDARLRLALFVQTKRTLLTLLFGLSFFLLWDLAGIGLGVFWEGRTAWLVGIDLAPQLPIEEPFFLLLLCYLLLVANLGLTRWSNSKPRGDVR